MLERATPVLLVALGGALGSAARFLVGAGFARRFGTGWPWGTLFINLSGCFLIALFLGAASERYTDINPAWRHLFSTGFVGGYTTFSTFEYETMRLWQLGQPGGALAYVAASNVLGFGAVLLGSWVGRR